MDSSARLNELRADFVASSTRSMPVAGMIFWTVIAVAALHVRPAVLAYMVLFGSGMIFPMGIAIDRMTGRKLKHASAGNPVMELFLKSLALVMLVWPLVILCAQRAHETDLIVLGGAILMGIIWIPYGWAADDPVGLEHAVGRSVLSYAAYLFAPFPYKATAISVAVLLSYLYSLLRMRKSQPARAMAKQVSKETA